MSEKVPSDQALLVAESANMLSKDTTQMSAPDILMWQGRVFELSELCRTLRYKTYIAALGTALLAKATNPRIDAYSLKAGDQSSNGSYSARTVVSVLVDVSRRQKFDLGATGREPMNNRPFINSFRITRDMSVHAQAVPALRKLCDLCHEVNQLDAEGAQRALAAFILVRTKYVPKYHRPVGSLAIRTAGELSESIRQFVTERSERGLRAQCCVGGLLDVIYDPKRVRVGKLHEPDRRTPGDVAILSDEALGASTFERIFEVRDKPVLQSDISAVIHKVATHGIQKAAVVAIAYGQGALDMKLALAEAEACGICLEIFTSWELLVRSIVFWARDSELSAVECTARQTRLRLQELEASSETVASWDALVLLQTKELLSPSS